LSLALLLSLLFAPFPYFLYSYATSTSQIYTLSLHDALPISQAIDYVQAVFSVQYGNKETAGENLLDIKSDGDSYEVNFDLDHWMLSSNQYARFEMQDCMVRPELYQDTSERPFKSKETQKIKLNWADHEAIFSNKDDQKKFNF